MAVREKSKAWTRKDDKQKSEAKANPKKTACSTKINGQHLKLHTIICMGLFLCMLG